MSPSRRLAPPCRTPTTWTSSPSHHRQTPEALALLRGPLRCAPRPAPSPTRPPRMRFAGAQRHLPIVQSRCALLRWGVVTSNRRTQPRAPDSRQRRRKGHEYKIIMGGEVVPSPVKQATAMKTPLETSDVPCISGKFLLVEECATGELLTRNHRGTSPLLCEWGRKPRNGPASGAALGGSPWGATRSAALLSYGGLRASAIGDWRSIRYNQVAF